ncbi:MAG: response regulator [Myxococcota bacterium]
MSITVMVVDDSSVMRKIVIRTLRASGLNMGTVLEGSSGEEALKLITEGNRPQLIVSDINMGGMDGITFVRHARSVLPPALTRIVMITTEGGADKINAAMSAGANAYLTKPFTPEQVANSLGPLV